MCLRWRLRDDLLGPDSKQSLVEDELLDKVSLLGQGVLEFAVLIAEKLSGRLMCWSTSMRPTVNMFCWLKLKPVSVNSPTVYGQGDLVVWR